MAASLACNVWLAVSPPPALPANEQTTYLAAPLENQTAAIKVVRYACQKG
jgi:hypothetical protein